MPVRSVYVHVVISLLKKSLFYSPINGIWAVVVLIFLGHYGMLGIKRILDTGGWAGGDGGGRAGDVVAEDDWCGCAVIFMGSVADWGGMTGSSADGIIGGWM